jgi:hypothetical protein
MGLTERRSGQFCVAMTHGDTHHAPEAHSVEGPQPELAHLSFPALGLRACGARGLAAGLEQAAWGVTAMLRLRTVRPCPPATAALL